MAKYQDKDKFLLEVNKVNPNFNNSRSSLKSLIEVLNSDSGSADQVTKAIQKLAGTEDQTYITKANKYRKALWYLQKTYPIVRDQWVSVVPNESKSHAVLYYKKLMPQSFNPYQNARFPPDVDRLKTKNEWYYRTIEEFLYTTPGRKGIVLIHLGKYQDGMAKVIDGWMVLDHIKSALSVAKEEGCSLCNLHLSKNHKVCNQLQDEVKAFAEDRVVDIAENGRYHMGGRHKAFRDFVARHDYVVVMGFDADVCVRANLFGTYEHYNDGNSEHATVPPIISMSNVVTSRAVLVTSGNIDPIGHTGEYGLLYGT